MNIFKTIANSKVFAVLMSLIFTVIMIPGGMSYADDGNDSAAAKFSVEILVVDADSSDVEIPGSHFNVVNENDETGDPLEFTTGNDPEKIELAAGDYTITNYDPADGYNAADPVRVRISESGEVYIYDIASSGYVKNTVSTEAGERNDLLIIKCKKTDSDKESPSDGGSDDTDKGETETVSDVYTMTHHTFPCSFGETNTVVNKQRNGEPVCGDSRFVNYMLYGSIAHNGVNHVYARSRNILSPDLSSGDSVEKSCMILTPFMICRGDYIDDGQRTYTLGDELVNWGQSKGYDWTSETEIEDMSIDLESGCRFTDENGKPAELLKDASNTHKPYANFSWNADNDDMRTSAAEKSEYSAGNTELIFRDSGVKLTSEDGSSKGTFGSVPPVEWIMGSTVGYYLNPEYRGDVTIDCFMSFKCRFKVDGKSYEVTLKSPSIDPSFKVEDIDRKGYVADGDVSATVTSARGTETSSENDRVMGVMRGDTIDYKIDFSTEMEKQMLTYLYRSLSYGGFSQSEDVVKQLSAENVTLNDPYFNRWFQPAVAYAIDEDGNLLDNDGNIVAWKKADGLYEDENGYTIIRYKDKDGNVLDSPNGNIIAWRRGDKYYDVNGNELKCEDIMEKAGIANLTRPELTVSFRLPSDKNDNGYNLEYSDDDLDRIVLNNSRSDGIQWKLRKSSIAYDESTRTISFNIYVSPEDIAQCGNSDPELSSKLKNIGSARYITDEGREMIKETLSGMGSNNLTISIPGVKVSNEAKMGTPFTAEAKVSGEMHFSSWPMEGIMGASVPAGITGVSKKSSASSVATDASASCAMTGGSVGASAENVQKFVKKVEQVNSDSKKIASAEKEIWSPDDYTSYESSISDGSWNQQKANGKLEAVYKKFKKPEVVFDLWDYDEHDLAFGNYYWTHLQDDSGKDCLQEENNSESMQYTVMIPSLRISKTVVGDTKTNSTGSYRFTIKLADPDDGKLNEGVKYNAILKKSNSSPEDKKIDFGRDGTAEFSLCSGDTLEIMLPFGTEYTIEEPGSNKKSSAYDPSFSVDGASYISDRSVSGKVNYINNSAELRDYRSGLINHASIINKRKKNRVIVEKKWVGDAADSVKVYLFRNGQKIDETVLSRDNDWKHVFDGLLTFDDDGNEYKYEVKEKPVDGYKADITSNDTAEGTEFTITNTKTTSISVVKKWKDNRDRAERRPDSIKVQLRADGKDVGSPVTLNDRNGWRHTWKDLDEIDAETGEKIEYTVVEKKVPSGYKSEATVRGSKFIITNTLKPHDEKTDKGRPGGGGDHNKDRGGSGQKVGTKGNNGKGSGSYRTDRTAFGPRTADSPVFYIDLFLFAAAACTAVFTVALHRKRSR